MRVLACLISAMFYSAVQSQNNAIKDFADTSLPVLKQLQSFPSPRFRTGVNIHRNFPWFDFLYLSYDYRLTRKNKTGAFVYPKWNTYEHAQNAIQIDYEMYKNWNYYFNLPSPTYGAANYLKPRSFANTFAVFADQHPEMPVCTYTFWAGLRPEGQKKAYIKTLEAIDPCKDSSYPLIQKDGKTQREKLNMLIKAMPNRAATKKIDFINENGEVFGPVWTPNGEGYRGNPFIACIQPDSATARYRRGKWQYEVFNTYKKQLINNDSIPGLKETAFSFYQISGFLPEYYGEYSQTRRINQQYNGMYYSTPDFYPGDINHNIFERYAAMHGTDCIAEGRKTEIALGDIYFSPFVCAGWFRDSLNYRPAPWLASLKALSLMGAEFFYPAFFNVSNPSKKKPVHPSLYAYQIAMPIYAQALTTHYKEIFYQSKNFEYEKDGDFLLLYREHEKQKGLFVISANWFNKGTGNNPDMIVNDKKVKIAGEKLRINFRRQGSVYIYDRRDSSNVLFYQLDEWHESAHPYYWSKNLVFEAELSETDNAELRTEIPEKTKKGDYTQFITYAIIGKQHQRKLLFTAEPRSGDSMAYQIRIKLRTPDSEKKPSIKVLLNQQEISKTELTTKEDFEWLNLKDKKNMSRFMLMPGTKNTIEIICDTGMAEIDKIELNLLK